MCLWLGVRAIVPTSRSEVGPHQAALDTRIAVIKQTTTTRRVNMSS